MQQLPQQGVAATNEIAIEAGQQQQQQEGPAGQQPGLTVQQTGGVSRAGDDFIMNYMTEEDVLQDLLNDREGDVGADNSDSDYSASAQQEEASSSGDPDDHLGSDGGYSNDSGSSGGGYGGGGSRRRSRRSKRWPSRRQRRERKAAAAAAAAGGGHNLRPRRQRGDSSQPEDEPFGVATRSRPHT